MKNKGTTDFVEEITALKEKFETIKKDTEAFMDDAKKLSARGADEAKDLIDYAKKNWQSVVSGFSSTGISNFFKSSKSGGKGKKAKKKATKKTSKAAASSKKKAKAKKK